MHFTSRSKMSVAISLAALVVIVTGLLAMGALRGATSSARAANASTAHSHIDCAAGAITCSEVWDSEAVFGEGKYIGHDEPSTLFYSNVPGSGNQMRYQLTLPKDPSPNNPTMAGKSFNFELHPAFWFGMAMCDTQSYPEQISTCSPDSDTNIVDPAISPKHAGTAFMEMQFYPPGWVAWPAGNSCDATKWCAALNIDSLSENPVTGQFLNNTCAAKTGVEYVNFAFMTKNGVPQPGSPPNPVNATINTFTPNPSADVFMNSGDNLTVAMHDTPVGLQIVINDQTTGQSGSMTTSKANGFGQVQFDPTGTSCNNIPYCFHPMYSPSSEQTRVPWAAHSYNIAFSDEIGHFDFCGHVPASGGCTSTEGAVNDIEKTDSDDNFCMDASASLLIKVSGCLDTNSGFDGASYLNVWPDGNPDHPTPIVFTSARTGGGFNLDYERVAFEADLPRIEAADVSPVNSCNRSTGARCVKPPLTDEGVPADFYPFFSSASGYAAACTWAFGNDIPGHTVNDFGQIDQYGPLLRLTYPLFGGLGATTSRFNDFRQVMSNPCTP